MASGISYPPGIGYVLVRKKPEEIDIVQLVHYNIAWMDALGRGCAVAVAAAVQVREQYTVRGAHSDVLREAAPLVIEAPEWEFWVDGDGAEAAVSFLGAGAVNDVRC